MITFVCNSKIYIRMNKYNIVPIFLGLILVNSDVIFRYDFHKIHWMQFTLLLLQKRVLNACGPTQMHLKVKANTFMNKPLIMNKIHYNCWK